MTHTTQTYADFLASTKVAAEATLARITGRVHVINIHTRGTSASILRTSATTFDMTYPAAPLHGRLTRADADLFTAFWIHEVCGHAVQTDFGAWDRAVKAGLANITNALEDVRIERDIDAKAYAVNGRRGLERLMSHMTAKALANGWKTDDMKQMPWALAIWGRAIGLGYNIADLPDLGASGLPSHVIKAMRKAIEATMRAPEGPKGTARVLAIAKRFAKDVTQGQDGESQDGQGQDGESQDGQGQDGEGQDGEGQDGEGQDGEGQGQGAAFDSQTESAEMDVSSIADRIKRRTPSGDPAGDYTDPNADMERKYGDAIRDWIAEQVHGGERMTDSDFIGGLGSGAYGKAYATARALLPRAARLRNDLRAIVKAPERVSRDRGHVIGRFDRRSISRAMAGATNVCTRREVDEAEETAVLVLWDQSGSMGDRCGAKHAPCTYAATLCIHIAEAIESAGAPVAVYGFGGRKLDVMKGWGQRMQTRRPAFGWGAGNCPGGTPLVPATREATTRMQRFPAPRRLILTLTDGTISSVEVAAVRAIQLIGAAHGIEYAGIGIGKGIDVSPLYDICQNVENPADLARDGLATLRRAIEAGRR